MWSGQAARGQLGLMGIFFTCYAGRQAVLFVQEHFLDSFAAARSASLRRQLLERIFISRLQVVRENGTAVVASAALEGVDQVESYLKLILPKMVGVATIPLVILVSVSAHDGVSGIVLLVMFPVIAMFMVMLGRTAKAKAEVQYGSYLRLSNHFIDTLRGIDTLAAFGAMARERNRVFQVSERFRKATMDTMKIATLSGAVLDMCTVFGIGAVAIMLGLRLADGSIALATALPVLVLAPDYFKPIRDFASDFHASLDGKNALADLSRMIAHDDTSAREGATIEEGPHVARWSSHSTLELQDVGFRYESESPALQGISLHVRGYRKIGIVGASGAGKSTLVNLMGGFAAPENGRMLVDGAPVDSLGLASWQQQALYIPQEPYLFHATLRDNIAFCTPDATDEAIEHAVDVVGLRDLIDQLPHGLDTIVGEGGRGLSGGQAQRIALARVLLDPQRKILLFDEPTAHLDIETELELKERMLPLMEDRLVLFATHRLHWLRDMDLVLVLDGGRIVEAGTPTDLLATDGALTRLARTINAGFDGAQPTSTGFPGALPCTSADTAQPGGDGPARHASDVRAKAPTPADSPAADNETRFGLPGFNRWVRPYFHLFRKKLLLALVLGLIACACSALLMYTAGFLISFTADPALPTIAAIMNAVAFVQIFGIGRPLSRYAERLASHDWVFRMTSNLRVRLFGIAGASAMRAQQSSRMGDFLGLVVEDIGHLQNLFIRTLFPAAIAGVLCLAVLAFYGAFDMQLVLAMLAVLGTATVIMPIVSLRINRSRIDARKQYRNELYAELTDNVLGAADWIFAGRGEEYLERHEQVQWNARAVQRRLDRYEHANDLVEAVIFGIGAVTVTLWAGTHFASGNIGGAANWIAAFSLGYFPLVEALAPVAGAVTDVGTHADALTRLNALPRAGDSAPTEPAINHEADNQHLSASAPVKLPHALPIDLHHVSFAYEGTSLLALRDITLHIPAGQKVAILGRSGAGKSTLAQIVRGDLHPHAGDVRIGSRAVADIATAMPQYLGLVQQQIYLFNRTLRENLSLGCPSATDDQLWEALRKVSMDQVAKRLPRGLDTMLDEAGTQFSGGERHRLAFARVLLANTPIVLLDEPMVGLDPAIEHGLIDTIFAACAEKTLIMVTHHLQDIARFDRVIFVEDARIELDGGPAELTANNARFQTLLQFDRGL